MKFSPRIASALLIALGVLIALQVVLLVMATSLLHGVRAVPIILGTGIAIDTMAWLAVFRASRRFHAR